MTLSFPPPIRFQLVQTPGESQARPGRPRDSMIPQRRWMALLLLLGFGWRMIGLAAPSLAQLELDTIRLSTRPLDEMLAMPIAQQQNGTLYYLLMRPWLLFFGTDPFSLRYTSVLISTIAIALMWQIARRMLPAAIGGILRNLPLLSTLFLVANPYHLRYSQEGGMYALVMTLGLLSGWSWLQAMWHSGFWRWLSYLLITSLSIYTHVVAALLLPVHLVWFLLANPLNRRRWKGYAAALCGFLLPLSLLTEWGWRYLASVAGALGFPLDERVDALQNILGGLPVLPLTEMARILLLNHAQGVLNPISHIWLIPIFFLGLTGLLVGYTEFGGRAANVGMLAAWLILPLLLLYAISLVAPIFADPPPPDGDAAPHAQGLIWIAPAFAMFLALGAQVMRRAYGRLGNWLAVGLILFVLGFWGYSWWEQTQPPIRIQLGAAAHFTAVGESAPFINHSPHAMSEN